MKEINNIKPPSFLSISGDGKSIIILPFMFSMYPVKTIFKFIAEVHGELQGVKQCIHHETIRSKWYAAVIRQYNRSRITELDSNAQK